MKKIIVVVLALACVVSFLGISHAGIDSTKHYFASEGWAPSDGSGSVCGACHTPHSPVATGTDAVLWNHQINSTADYTLYSGTKSTSSASTLGASSLVCLGCHDGTIGLESFGGTETTVNMIASSVNITQDLGNNHPVGYISGSTGGVSGNSPDYWRSGKVECGSCHDPHTSDQDYFVRVDNSASALCIACHSTQ